MKSVIKQSLILLLCITAICSCKTKAECPAYDTPESKEKSKESTKYEVIILKDGKRIGGTKTKKGKSKLFKKKVLR